MKKVVSVEPLTSMNHSALVEGYKPNNGLDSMSFPNTCEIDHPSWDSSFKENLFSTPSGTGARAEVAARKTITKTCEFCGSRESDSLKLCSACQTTYYCSHECQTRDWIKGHAMTCKPVQ